MLIVSSPICPRCRACVMTRVLSWLDWAAIVGFLFLFFPIAIWIYLTPRRLACRNCGKILADQPDSDS